VTFRPPDGGTEHVAILIGDPEAKAAAGEAVLARLHSECFTGDLLGSLRCDCGDQLRGAFFGSLALRLLRGTNEIEVRVNFRNRSGRTFITWRTW